MNSQTHLFEEMGRRGHEGVHFASDRESGLQAIIGIHSSILGPALGGTRIRPYSSIDEALTDVLRLSRGMTYKAAAAGLPVIATAVGAVSDVLTSRPPGRSRFREGLAPLVPPHDPATLAREMTRLALDEPLRRRIGQALRSHVAANYNVDQQVRRVARLYESILPRWLTRRRPGDEPWTSVCAPAPAWLRPAAHTRHPSSEQRRPDTDRPEPTAIATRH